MTLMSFILHKITFQKDLTFELEICSAFRKIEFGQNLVLPNMLAFFNKSCMWKESISFLIC